MTEPYPTPAGVEAAIKAAAKQATAVDGSLTIDQRVRLEHFDRFLSRVFSDEASCWLLKGGTAMLARLPSARATRDIDLAGCGLTLDEAFEDLVRLSKVDLGDHFRFALIDHADALGGDNQPYADGYRVTFEVYVGGAPRGNLKVDLVTGVGVTTDGITMEPAYALALPRLVSNPYQLYSVVDQIADKVCATMAGYREHPSSREKDLVDLVALATTQDVDGRALQVAISSEVRRRRMEPFDHFTVPVTWGSGYAALSARVPYCDGYREVEAAAELVARLVDPVLVVDPVEKVWSHVRLGWE